jgi:hypothetical protein
MRLLRVFLSTVVLALLSSLAHAQQECYVDRGNEVCFPHGARSFADAVTRFDVGDPASKFASANVVSTTLGEPDNDRQNETEPEEPQNYLTLGCGGTLTLQFRDNALIDVPGSDLYVFEIGDHVEPTHLSISTDGKNWLDVGTISGGLAAVDISPVTAKGRKYRFVRLQDARKRCDGRWPGADIDAVGAIGSVALADGRLSVLASETLALTPTHIGLILDASGSMWGRLDSGEAKISVAKRAIRSIVSTMPMGPQVGLRVYGHRLKRKPKDKSCLDSELLVPFGPLDRQKIIRAVEAVNPKGQTPIGRSLTLMSEDMASGTGFKVIIVVSDGIETCSPNSGDPDFPPDVVQAMKTSGVKFRANVVGFDIDQSETREFLTQIAEASGGRYIGANNARELETAIRGAIELAYLVQDTSGKTVFEGTVGAGPIDLPPGRYSVLVLGQSEFTISNVDVAPGVETRLTIHEVGDNPRVERITVSIDGDAREQ